MALFIKSTKITRIAVIAIILNSKRKAITEFFRYPRPRLNINAVITVLTKFSQRQQNRPCTPPFRKVPLMCPVKP